MAGAEATFMPSFILIRQTVWPQCTNITDRQTGQDRQWSDSIERTVLQTVAQKQFALCYQTVVCLSVLSVCDVGVLWPDGWMDQDKTWHEGSLGPGHSILDGDPAPPPQKGHNPNFWSMSVVAKRLDGLRCHLVRR